MPADAPTVPAHFLSSLASWFVLPLQESRQMGASNERQQPRKIERLGQEKSREAALLGVTVERALDAGMGAHHRYGDVAHLRVLLEVVKKLPAVHGGHHEIEKDQARKLGRCAYLIERVEAVTGAGSLVAFGVERLTN